MAAASVELPNVNSIGSWTEAVDEDSEFYFIFLDIRNSILIVLAIDYLPMQKPLLLYH